VTDPDDGGSSPPFSGRAAYVITQSYSYVAAVIGVGLLLGGTIAALIAIRHRILPSSEAYGPGLDTSREAARSLLGALAFVIPGALVFVWHIRQARGGEGAYRPGAFWGSALYFHLVALIALVITLGGVTGGLLAVRDAALPYCYGPSTTFPPVATPVPGVVSGVGSGVEVSLSPDALQALSQLQRDCSPPSSEALRNALDAAIVALVAGGVWLWHLSRGRREVAPPPPAAEPREPAPPPAA